MLDRFDDLFGPNQADRPFHVVSNLHSGSRRSSATLHTINGMVRGTGQHHRLATATSGFGVRL